MQTCLLHTERIRLRAPEPEDLEQMFRFENDEELWGNGGVTGPYSHYQLRKYIAESQNDLFSDGQLRLVIETANGGMAGIADLFHFDARNRRAEVGIMVRKECRRMGIAKESLLLLERHSFEFVGIHQLYAHVREDNQASLALFTHAGYTLSGTLTDWLRLGDRYYDVCVVQKKYRENPMSK